MACGAPPTPAPACPCRCARSPRPADRCWSRRRLVGLVDLVAHRPANASVAVLPFDNLGGDEATGRLADGITEDLITELTRFRGHRRDRPRRHPSLQATRRSTSARSASELQVRLRARRLDPAPGRAAADHRAADRDRAARATSGPTAGTGRATICSRSRARSPRQSPASIASPYSGQIVAVERDSGQAQAAQQPVPPTISTCWAWSAADTGQPRGLPRRRSRSPAAEPRTSIPSFARAWTGLAMAYSGLAEMEGYPAEHGRRPARRPRARRWRSIRPTPRRMRRWRPTTWMPATRRGPRPSSTRRCSLNPGSADLLAIYAGWASGFGEPEHGVDAAERAMRLNPDTPALGGLQLRLRLLHGRPLRRCAAHVRPHAGAMTYTPSAYVYRAATLGALGKTAAAKRAVAAALALQPDLSIETFAASLHRQTRPTERLHRRLHARSRAFPCAAAAASTRSATRTFLACRSASRRDASVRACRRFRPCAPSRRRRAISASARPATSCASPTRRSAIRSRTWSASWAGRCSGARAVGSS